MDGASRQRNVQRQKGQGPYVVVDPVRGKIFRARALLPVKRAVVNRIPVQVMVKNIRIVSWNRGILSIRGPEE